MTEEVAHILVTPLSEIADGLKQVAEAIDRLGTADAATPMGAIELLAKEVKDAGQAVASSLSEIASNG